MESNKKMPQRGISAILIILGIVIVVGMLDNFKLKVEYQSESCEKPLEFSNPTTYQR